MIETGSQPSHPDPWAWAVFIQCIKFLLSSIHLSTNPFLFFFSAISTEHLHATRHQHQHTRTADCPLWAARFSCSVTQSCPTLCNPMDCSTPGFPYPSLSPRVCSNSCPLSQWCHPTISSSVDPLSSCPQSFPALGSFPMSQLFASCG